MNYADVVDYLPETEYFTESIFWDFIKNYETVILKPVRGARGQGVIKVERVNKNQYSVHHGSTKTSFDEKDQVWSYLLNKTQSTVYIVQQYIPLASIDNRPFDIRVMVQRRKRQSWEVTGKLAKVAGQNYIITNVARSGGSIIPFPVALQKSNIDNRSLKNKEREIESVALLIVDKLTGLYPYQKVWGLDMAIDVFGNIWLIEANVWPNIYMFKKLKDKSMYNKIKLYKGLGKKRKTS